MKLNVRGSPSSQYLSSNMKIEILSEDRRVVVGYALRTGLTAPYYPDHPIYKFTERPWDRDDESTNSWLPEGRFVWDGAEFYESRDWHADHYDEAIAAYEARQAQLKHKTKRTKAAAK